MDTEHGSKSAGMERFGIVPASILEKGLSHKALALYLVLAIHADAERKCWPSQETLAQMLGVRVRWIRKYLKELKGAGLVVCEYRRGTALYTLLPGTYVPTMNPGTTVPTLSKVGTTVPTRSAQPCPSMNSNKEHSISLEKLDLDLDLASLERASLCSRSAHMCRPSKNTGDTSVAQNGHKRIDMTDFESKLADFVDAYPRPEGGMPARKIVERAFHRVFYDGANLADVVDGARRYAAFLRDHPDRPVQDPVRWLERREWEREWKAPQAQKPMRSPVYDRATMLAAQKWQAGYRWRECVDEAREQLLKEGEHPRELIYAPFGSYGIIHEQEVVKNGHH